MPVDILRLWQNFAESSTNISSKPIIWKESVLLKLAVARASFTGLKEFPVEVHGIEHDPALVELAKSKGIDVVQGFTETEDTVFPDGLYDVFLSFNFLEHQPDPVTMLRAIWNNLEDDAMGLITVPSFEYIMEHSSYYELIRDHIAYYTFDTLTSLMERSGFDVVEASMINRDTLSLIVRKTSTGGNRKPAGVLRKPAGRDEYVYEVSEGMA